MWTLWKFVPHLPFVREPSCLILALEIVTSEVSCLREISCHAYVISVIMSLFGISFSKLLKLWD